MTALGTMTVLLAIGGSRSAAGVVGHYQRFESITASGIGIAIAAIWSFLRRIYEKAYYDQDH